LGIDGACQIELGFNRKERNGDKAKAISANPASSASCAPAPCFASPALASAWLATGFAFLIWFLPLCPSCPPWW